MNLEFLITELNVGGAEKILTELAIRLQARGHQLRVLTIASEPKGPQRRLLEQLRDHQVEAVCGGFDRPSQVISAARWVRKQWQLTAPDLCQTFLFHANCIGAFAARRAGVRRVVGGLRVAEPNTIRDWLERKAIVKMDRLICVSSQVREFAHETLGAPDSKLVVIPNGVDVQRFDQVQPMPWSRWGWPDESDVILFVGRFHPQKGLEQLRGPFENWLTETSQRKLMLVGQGPLEGELAAWAKKVGHQSVRVIPWQSDVAPLMKASRLLILPSHYEGMPNVVLEAMAAARPVVCSRVQGSKELLGDRDGDQGFAPGDVRGMTQLVKKLISNPGRRETIGRANREHVLNHFSLDSMVDRYEQNYQQLVP